MMKPYAATKLDTHEGIIASVESKLSQMVMSTTLALTEAIGAYYASSERRLTESLEYGERRRLDEHMERDPRPSEVEFVGKLGPKGVSLSSEGLLITSIPLSQYLLQDAVHFMQ